MQRPATERRESAAKAVAQPSLAAMIEEEMEIPPFPAVAQAAVTATRDPSSTPEQIALIITKDPGLTLTLLKTMNSAFFGMRSKVKSVDQAVVLLGMRATRFLVISAASKQLYKKHTRFEELHWSHSMGAALATRLVVRAVGGDKEEAFLAGLLHDTGKVVMANEARDRFMLAMARTAETGQDSCEAEQDIFGFTHADVGQLLIRRWKLPGRLADAASFHHDLDLARSVAGDSFPLVCATAFADAICHHLAIGTGRPADEADLVAHPATLELGLGSEGIQELVWSVRSAYEQERAGFA